VKPFKMEDWKKLTPKEKWDVMVTLRGPDTKKPLLKFITTAVIRARMREIMEKLDMRVGGMVAYQASAIILPNTVIACPVFDSIHFLTHIREAAEILKIYIIRVPEPIYVQVLEKSLRTGAEALVTALSIYDDGRRQDPETESRLMCRYLTEYAGLDRLEDNDEDD
jgi:hypothetical protein